MESTFSEFSYGFALTQELASGRFGSLVAAPVCPSLIQEGQPGGGYDVKLPLIGAPLFLQFKFKPLHAKVKFSRMVEILFALL